MPLSRVPVSRLSRRHVNRRRAGLAAARRAIARRAQISHIPGMTWLRFPAPGRLVSAAIIGFSAAAAAHSAQEVPPPADADTIVITGERLTREELRERAVAFVRGTGVASGRTPVARWAEPVCLKVMGIRGDQAEQVARQMKVIAASAGVGIAEGDCKANAWITFTADAAALVQEIDRRSPRRLAEVPREARDALIKGDAPVRWWYLTDTRSRHGQKSMRQTLDVEGASGTSGGASTSNSPLGVEAIAHYGSSVISTQVVRAIGNATVVFDADAVKGHSLEAIAAYAAMVAFAEIRDAEFVPEGSILGLFHSPDAPQEMTAQDAAFLRALYRLPLDREAQRHRGQLVVEMVTAAFEGDRRDGAN